MLLVRLRLALISANMNEHYFNIFWGISEVVIRIFLRLKVPPTVWRFVMLIVCSHPILPDHLRLRDVWGFDFADGLKIHQHALKMC